MSAGCWGSLFVLCASVAVAEQVPAPGAADARVRVAHFTDGEVYRLVGRVGFQIELELEPGEVYRGHGGGDLDGIVIAAHDAHVMVKPRAEGVETNLVVFTDRRTYRFHYVVERQAVPLVPQELIYAVRFQYPEVAVAESATRRIAARLDQARAQSLNKDYWYCGAPSLQPVAMFDDGVRTHLRFAERAEWPTLFVLNDDKSESLVNFTAEGNDMIVHRTARRFVVRRGALVGCIVNKGYAGSGERLESGTLVPDVVRDAVEIGP
jgi:type IV secretion system protein VirB9